MASTHKVGLAHLAPYWLLSTRSWSSRRLNHLNELAVPFPSFPHTTHLTLGFKRTSHRHTVHTSSEAGLLGETIRKLELLVPFLAHNYRYESHVCSNPRHGGPCVSCRLDCESCEHATDVSLCAPQSCSTTRQVHPGPRQACGHSHQSAGSEIDYSTRHSWLGSI